ncbi:MAG TPA: hypothetical protein VH413_10875 [Verrucomicrobiae bacterium]|jgi:hypothetical protein|nr:hypothetical protein [Verrucomicrobiae bacterium]
MKTFRSFSRALKNPGAIALFIFLFACAAPSQTPTLWLSPVVAPYVVPQVRILSPANRATFYSPVDIPIFVYAGDYGPNIGQFTNVEIFAGTNDLGAANRVSNSFPRGLQLPQFPYGISYLPEFTYVWTNPPPATYSLRAVARRTRFLVPDPSPIPIDPAYVALSVTSAPVTITVLPPISTGTNRLDIVRVVATDPIAVAGTNCWVTLGSTNATPSWTNWPPIQFTRITNCGPKSATFTFTRYGDVSADLAINYNITGTATNGLDYAVISNTVVIPAGQAYAQTTIVPMDAAQSNLLSRTVILSITPSTNQPPAYAVGYPARAEAVIFENLPRTVAVLPDQSFHVNAIGPDGAWFRVEYTTDLLNWTPVCTNQVVQGSIDFVDPDATNNASRFYRAIPQ